MYNALLTIAATESIFFDGRATKLGSVSKVLLPSQSSLSPTSLSSSLSSSPSSSPSLLSLTLETKPFIVSNLHTTHEFHRSEHSTTKNYDAERSYNFVSTLAEIAATHATRIPNISQINKTHFLNQKRHSTTLAAKSITSSCHTSSESTSSTPSSLLSLNSQLVNDLNLLNVGIGKTETVTLNESYQNSMPPPPDSPHADLAPRKRRRKRDDPQSYFNNSEDYDSDEGSPVSCSDVESFQGKIVYNPDGSAYIIDSENDSLSNISETGLAAGLPTANNPKIHSFRVVTARDATINKISEPNKIQKPILMCFICKLSFGNTKSFSLHANSEHTLNLHESEKLLLNREYSSAIIQRNVDEKPQISFLEPLDVHKQLFQQHQQQFQNSSIISSSSTPSAPSECVSTTNATGNTPSSSCTPASSAATNNLCSMLLSSSGINSQMLDSTVATVTAPSSSSLSSSTLSSSLPTSQSSSTAPQASITTTPVSSLTLNNSNKLNSDISTSGTLINSNTICSSSNIVGQNLSDFVQQQLKQQHQQSLMRVSTPSPTLTPALGLTSCSPTSAGLSNTSNNNNDSSNIHSNSQQTSPKQTPSSTSNVSSFLSSTVTTSVGETSGVTSAGDLSTNNNSNNNSSNNNSTKLLNEFLQQQQILQQQQHSSSQNLSCPEHQGFKISGLIDCKSCELINITNLKSSPMTPTKSPNSINLTTTSSSASLTSISPTTPAPSFTIGACPDHINGRPIGVDCARCEMILSSARLNSGSQISTRNSCKTLKCPQCNWHYKYQETLEIHMREKHPDGESACGYCLAGQQHPRLARGESYTCGYKPYRCEICNYSTTTKGNLSIHMQSDKHLNNMQELNNSQNLSSSNDIRENPKIVMPNMPQQANKPKPSFRCDVCSYETSVARNLRIHMTSEKHTHNMAVLQNNMKHFQALSFLQSQNLGAAAAVNIPNLSNMSSLQQNMPNLQNFLPEAALADLAYNQALMIQLLHQNSAAGALGAAAAAAAAAAALPQSQQQQQQQPQSISQQLSSSSGCSSASNQLNVPTSGSSSTSAASSNAAAVAAAALLGSSLEPDQGLNLETMEPPIEPDQRPTTVFSCLICSVYNTNSIEELNNHLMIDRSRNTGSAASNCNNDIMLIINNNYICRLCNYKTNLKANFQLHSKTDKHIQKLNYINHIKEGGPKNEYKLKYNNSNTVQLKCNCCDFYTNSIQKLNLHSQHMRHDTMKMIFNHLVYIDQMYSIQLHRRASTSTPTISGVNSQQSSSDNNQRLNATSGNSDIDHQQQIGTSSGVSSIVEASVSGGSGGGSIIGKQSQQQQQQQQQLTHSIVCELCSYKAGTVLQMIQHVKSIRHVQVEQFICLQRRSENLEPLELSDVFKIIENGIIKSEKCSPANSPVDANLGGTLDQLSSGQTSTPIPRLSENIGGVSSSSSLLQTPSSLPMSSSMATLMKCSNCDFFCETKQDIEMHLESMHPNSGTNEYLTIPANSMALHAFQAAVAAATAAAEANKSSSSPLAGNTGMVSSVTPNSLDEIKSERMDADMDSVGDGTELDQQDLDGIESSDAHCNVALSVLCPLCQDSFNDRKSLETHVMGVHSVNSDGLTRLLQLVDTSHWLNSTNNTKKENEDMSSERNHASNNLGGQQMRGDELECAQCGVNIKTHQELLMHAQDTQHYSCTNDQYQCLLKQCPQTYNNLTTMIAHFKDTHMNIVISERHVYKYRCKQCSLAFKTQEKLNTHSLYHTMRDATKCMICNRSFRSTQSLQKHMEQAHNQQSNSPSPPPCEQDQVKSTAASSTEDFLTSPSSMVKQDDESGQAHDLMLREDQLILHHGSLLDCSNPTSEMDEYLNTPQIAEETYNDPTRKHKCHKCKMAFTHQNFLAMHYKSNQHRRNEKLNNYPMEKYLDPNRPFKCEICLESFTQKNILLVHYNSVSHLHKLKKQSENNNTPSSSPSNNPSPMDYDRKSVDSDRRSVERDRKSVDLDLEIMNEQHKRKLSPENDYDSPKKRFKCDICKVAYAQGSTLDIHMRSVLHQTRACRLQEQQQQQQQQIQQHALQFNPSLTSSLARIVEQHQQQQQLQQSISPAPSNLSGVQDDPNMPKFNNQIYKTLLENFGFDIVKQFNELKHTGAEMSRELSDEKYFCRHCKKTFSSIFVLKSHCEEIHNDKIPLDVLEKFAEKFKNYYLEGSDVDNEILDFSAKKMSPESSHSPNSSLNGSGNALNISTKDSQSIVNQPPTTPVSMSGLSPPLREASPSSQQQQALLKPQQSARQSPEPQAQTPVVPPLQSQQTPPMLPTDLAQKFNIDPAILAQRIMEQNLASVPPNFANLPQNLQGLQNLQNLQNLQSLQNLPNMPNLPLNTLDMLSLMQFHHLMSLNFMNLAPPLIFGATGAAAAAAAIAGGNVPPVTPELPVNPTHQVQLLQQQAAAAAQATNNQKRARTRITDEQLKILRAHFDINNSPSEESIMEMSKKANLPMKVVKHWFRNTLFKERQRNKDSPYNFNNPPSTTLNLEEYERTGHAKVTPLVEQGGNTSDTSQSQQQQQQQQTQSQQRQHQELQAQFQQQQQQMNIDNRPLSQPSSTASERGADIQIKAEPNDDLSSYDPDQQSMPQHSHHPLQHPGSHMMKHDQQHDHDSSGAGGSAFQQSQHQQQMFYNNFETKSESGSSEILSRPQTPNNTSYSNLGDMTGQQMDPVSLGSLSSGLAASPAGTAGLAGVVGNLNNMGPPKKFQINKIFDKNNFETNSNSSNSSSSSGKRANRTRFTDYQIKVLQEFFENNSYPKDSDLEYLSKLLLLSPRVIVVWFQNARQKQRKIYENQPNNSFYESEDKKPNINYTCKKCNLVFQRYYELIRHQKNHCFKEENNKKSAKAQIAAAQIAQSLSSEDSNSSIDVNSANLLTSNLAAQQAAAAAAAAVAIGGQVTNLGLAPSPSSTSGPGSLPAIPGLSTSPGLGLLTTSHGVFSKHTGIGSIQNTGSVSSKDGQSPQKFECDKCNLSFSRFELFKEHQLIHIMNPNLFLNQSYAENTPFGILQNMQNSLINSGSSSSGNSNLLMGSGSQDTSIDLSQPSSKKKRKYSETLPPTDTPGDDIQAMMGMQVTEYDLSKKLKSEQYDFLYQYFLQNEPNDELKKQYQQQQHHQNFDIEYLARFYQMNELKKKGNYDFFYQYYLQNEGKQGDSSAILDSLAKPNIEFLLQYYQLNECKKFFQLGASPQTVHDFPLLNLTTMTSASDANSVKNTPTQQNIPSSSGLEETPTVQMVSGSGNSTLRETFAASGRGTTPIPNSAASTNTQTTTEITGSTTSSMASMINSPTHAAAVVAATILAAGGSGVMGQKTRQEQLQPQQHLTSISTTIGGSNSNAGNSPQHLQQSSNSNSCLPVGPQVSNLQKSQHQQQLTNSTSNTSFHSSSPVTAQSIVNDFTNSNSSFINTNIMQTPTNNTGGGGGGMGGVEHVTTMEKQTNKRLRTTILPEQLNFLYECYQNESNPSRKMLEEISKKVNLKKRVVQVWYQNSRARERKGQFRQNLQIINKKCPYCGAIFKIKSALESHLQTKHPEKQPINIDQIPDVTQKPLENSIFPSLQSHGLNNLLSQTRPSPTPTSTTSNLASACATNTSSCGTADLNQYIQANHQAYQNEGLSSSDDNATVTSTMLDSVNPSTTLSKIGTPLDLSKATPKYEPSESDVSFSDSNNDQDESNDFFITASSTPANVFGNIHNNNNNSSLNNNHVKIADLVNYRHQSNNSPTTTSANLTSSTSPVRIGENNIGENRLTTNHLNDMHYDSDATSNLAITTQHQQHQNRDLSMLFNNDAGTDMDRSPASPASSTQSAQKKRFRTQMSNIQVRILRTLFTDVKTPTMSDCENIGREIGLPKRVVQVWFQNARAKEKKSRNNRNFGEETFEQSGNDVTPDVAAPSTDDCRICNINKVNMQEHIFSAAHILKVRHMLENGEHLIGYSGSESCDQPDTTDQQLFNVKSETKLTTPPPAVTTASGCVSPNSGSINHEQNLTVYNQLLMQNPMFVAAAATAATTNHNQGSGKLFGEQDGNSHAAITAAAAMMNFNHIKQHLVAVQQQQQQQHQQQQNQQQHSSDENTDECSSNSVAASAAAAAAHRLLMENNLLLQINTDQTLAQTANNSEALLQQIYNYNQMSEKNKSIPSDARCRKQKIVERKKNNDKIRDNREINIDKCYSKDSAIDFTMTNQFMENDGENKIIRATTDADIKIFSSKEDKTNKFILKENMKQEIPTSEKSYHNKLENDMDNAINEILTINNKNLIK